MTRRFHCDTYSVYLCTLDLILEEFKHCITTNKTYTSAKTPLMSCLSPLHHCIADGVVSIASGECVSTSYSHIVTVHRWQLVLEKISVQHLLPNTFTKLDKNVLNNLPQHFSFRLFPTSGGTIFIGRWPWKLTASGQELDDFIIGSMRARFK